MKHKMLWDNICTTLHTGNHVSTSITQMFTGPMVIIKNHLMTRQHETQQLVGNAQISQWFGIDGALRTSIKVTKSQTSDTLQHLFNFTAIFRWTWLNRSTAQLYLCTCSRRSAVEGPRPGGSASLITDSPVSGKSGLMKPCPFTIPYYTIVPEEHL